MPDHDIVEVRPSDLDDEDVGEELQSRDYVVLAVLGVLIPALLLVWGWQ